MSRHRNNILVNIIFINFIEEQEKSSDIEQQTPSGDLK